MFSSSLFVVFVRHTVRMPSDFQKFMKKFQHNFYVEEWKREKKKERKREKRERERRKIGEIGEIRPIRKS